jgi:hypothetical protein
MQKPRKLNVSGVFSCPKIFDGLSQVLTDSDGNYVVPAATLEKKGIAEYNKKRLTGTFRPSYSGVEDGRLCDGLLF